MASSESSGITGPDLSSFIDQQDISNLDLFEKDSTSIEWTDEKHSLYLKSIENSFVQQLYSSIESSGFHSHKKHPSYMRSSSLNESQEADQFKVHQHGCWQKIKFGRGEPPPRKAGKSRLLLQNPWIQHFRSRDNPIEGSASYVDETASFEGRAIYARALATLSDDFHMCGTLGDSSIGEEFSGQNFDEEDNDERTCSLHTTKRMKTVEAMTENPE